MVMNHLNEVFGEDKFTHKWQSDAGITGNFEISVNGTQVWSKKGGDGFPVSNWDKLDDAIKPLMK